MSRDAAFRNRHKFQDDVWGQIRLNDLERDVIDTPEFQRLFRTSQMGFVDLAYPTANHTRGAHCIGACHIANLLVDRLNQNTNELQHSGRAAMIERYARFEISQPERLLIRLGALLHDVSHVPLSHDIERKTHRVFYETRDGRQGLKLKSWYGHYDKHDDYETNPLLYLQIFDTEKSVLAQVLQRYSDPFYDVFQALPKESCLELQEFLKKVQDWSKLVEWNPRRHLLPQLLFHLLVFENLDEAKLVTRKIAIDFDNPDQLDWHLGPPSLPNDEVESWHRHWYQPFRHDIIGNTLSADLIDYLSRDPQRMATARRIDLHILNYYVLVKAPEEAPDGSNGKRKKQASDKKEKEQSQAADYQPSIYRCAIDLHDFKRGTTRMFLLNDLFRLLDLRHEIHEKAVMHRVVQSANAMLARGLLLLNASQKRPAQRDLVTLGSRDHVLQSEDIFLKSLLDRSRQESTDVTDIHLSDANRLFEKIAERRVYRPLMIIPGDRAIMRFNFPWLRSEKADEFSLRTLAAIVDSRYYSTFLLFATCCVEKYLEGVFETIDDLTSTISSNVAASASLAIAMQLIPSRLLIWTSPYKQLYKDPAVVVAFQNQIGQIDRLYPDTSSRPFDETEKRVRTAISDADSKYTSLWRLYVFMSDGLYYSGTLNKLLEEIGVSIAETHSQRLQNAQALVTVALEAICSDWSGYDDSLPTSADKQTHLEQQMDEISFKLLIRKWLADFSNETSGKHLNRAQGLSTVSVSDYVHRYTLNRKVDDADSRKCRDTRYKFDLSAESVWNDSTDLLAPSGRLVEFLTTCGISNPGNISQREFEELVELYNQPGMIERCAQQLAEGSPAEALKELWRWEPFRQEPAREYPTDALSIRRWLSTEGERLRGKRLVYREWSRATDRVTDFILSRDRQIWPRIFDDLHERIVNEAKLFWNNIKDQEIIDILERKWPS